MSSQNPGADFESALKLINDPAIHSALIDVHDTVGFAKKILLSNRVQQFTAADVVDVTRMILAEIRESREKEAREQAGNDE